MSEYYSYPGFVPPLAERLDLAPTRTIFENPKTFHEFMWNYVGDPITAGQPPIVRNRGGVEVDFNTRLLSACTNEGNHGTTMVHVRRADGQANLHPKKMYFVVTQKPDSPPQEWFVSEVLQTNSGFELFLSDSPVAEVHQSAEANEYTLLGSLALNSDNAYEEKLRRHNAHKIVIADTWQYHPGNGVMPLDFVSMATIANDLSYSVPKYQADTKQDAQTEVSGAA